MLDHSQIELRADQTRPGLRCPYCHDGLAEEEGLRGCEACQAQHHDECWGLYGGCSACGRKDGHERRRGAARAVSVEGGSDRLDIEWGDRSAAGRRVLIAAGLLLGLATVSGYLAFLVLNFGLTNTLGHGGEDALVLSTIAIVFSGFWGAVTLAIHASGMARSGRLRIDPAGVRIQRMTLTADYLGDELLPWSELDSFEVESSPRGRFVVAVRGGERRRLARAKSEPEALRILRQLQAARAHFHSAIAPETLQIRAADPIGPRQT